MRIHCFPTPSNAQLVAPTQPFSGRHSAAAERLWLPTALALLFHGTAPQGSVQAEAAVVRPSTTEQHLESTSDTKANKTAKKQKRKNLGGILGESIDNTATNVNVTKDISPDEIVDAEIVSLQPREEKGEGEAGGEREGVEEGSRGRGGGDLSKETGHGEGKGTGIAKADGPSTVQERLQTRFKRKRQQRQMGRGDDNTDADDNETASESGDKNAIDGGLRSRDQNDRDDGAKSKSGRQIVDDENQGPVGALGALVERREIDEHEDVRQEPTECVATGPCVWCAASEMEVEYCKETGRRQEVRAWWWA